jgi:hypothetical protein
MLLTDLTLPRRAAEPQSDEPVAQGNGEIRESVSILSACSSSAPLVCAPRNRCGGALPAAVPAVPGRLDTL